MSKKDNSKKGISRRNFIKVTSVGLGMSAFGFAPIHRAIAETKFLQQIKWDKEVDIVAVGAGPAGAGAALKSVLLGNEAIILEKSPAYGGTAIKSGGVMWVPKNRAMREVNISDPKIDAMKYMCKTAYPNKYNTNSATLGLSELEYKLIETYYDRASEVVDEFTSVRALDLTFWPSIDGTGPAPDYMADMPENVVKRGRSIAPIPLNGAMAGFVPFPMGFDLMQRMQKALEAHGIKTYYKHRVNRIIEDETGRVIGVSALNNNKEVYFKARKGVIFGSGGFAHNAEMVAKYLKGPIFGGGTLKECEGDLVNMAIEIGADLSNMENAWWDQIVPEMRLKPYNTVPADVFMVPGDSMIFVNKFGKRIWNEKDQYNTRGQCHFIDGKKGGDWPNILVFMIYDQRTVDYFGSPPGSGMLEMLSFIPAKNHVDNAAHVVKGNTLNELKNAVAGKLSQYVRDGEVPDMQLDRKFVSTLEETIERYNRFAVQGVDEDFFRGSYMIDRSYHGPRRPGNNYPNPTMYPISNRGPYYSTVLMPGSLGTKGGPKINEKAQVLDVNGNVIPGLYAAGNCSGHPAAESYWGGGATIGTAMVYGYLAAVDANRNY